MHTRRKTVIGLLVALLFLFRATPDWAWIDCGHQVVSLLAWEDMSPKTRAAVTELLKQHVRYQADLVDNLTKDIPADQVDKYIFAKASTWPDIVRGQANPMHTLYNHPSWHYIDLPFVMDNVTVPPDPNNQGPAPHNVVEAIAKCEADVVDDKISPSDRAVALCWIEHCIGDIHQPLHCTALYSKQYPEGDRGGNSESVLREPPYPNTRMALHLLWDSIPGTYQGGITDEYVMQGVRNDPNHSRDMLKPELAVAEPMDWAKTGRDLAQKYVYLEGKLESAPSNQHGKIPGVPPGYIAQGESIAMKQIALAGYRLADTLNAIFDRHP